jgi:uroporphyrinogen-III synthase
MSALNGKQIVITRAPHQASEFERLLREKGAVSLAYPCLDIVPPQNSVPFDDALRDAANGTFDWLVLTSANAVRAVANRLISLDLKLSEVKIAAVGPATAEAIRCLLGLEASLIPDVYTADELAKVMHLATRMRVLLPQSAIADEMLAQMLHSAGANIIAVEAYRTTIGSGGVNLPALLEAGAVDAITFASPSSVKNLLRRFEIERGTMSLLKQVCVACIGAKTADSAREYGFFVSVMPDDHTIPGLVMALEHYFDSEVRYDVQNKRRSGASL